VKAKDLAKYLLSLPEEQQELHISICCGGWECSPETGDVEVYEYEEKQWKYEGQQYIPLPSIQRLNFTEKEPEKPIKGEVLGNELGA
jgi:hypothetical protein